MRHRRIGRKLGVTTKHRKAMFRNMVTDLFRHDRIKTTDAKAKELRRVAEKLITLAKDGSLHKRRQAAAYVRDKEVLKKLFDEIAGKFKARPGGYTRIIKLGFRKGDNTPISVIELVEEEFKPGKKKKKAKAPSKKEPRAETVKTEAGPRSSKKESAEELGLVEDEQKTADAKPEAGADTVSQEPGSAQEPAPEEAPAPQAEDPETQAGEPAPSDTEAAQETPETAREPEKEE